jgi:hypothetical protein
MNNAACPTTETYKLDDLNYFPTKFLKQIANNISLSVTKPNIYPEAISVSS